jgi:hypothetical protein
VQANDIEDTKKARRRIRELGEVTVARKQSLEQR